MKAPKPEVTPSNVPLIISLIFLLKDKFLAPLKHTIFINEETCRSQLILSKECHEEMQQLQGGNTVNFLFACCLHSHLTSIVSWQNRFPQL